MILYIFRKSFLNQHKMIHFLISIEIKGNNIQKIPVLHVWMKKDFHIKYSTIF